MKIDKKVKKEISINADIDLVWDTLVKPDLIKQYLFGTETISDWKTGSDIRFRGEYNGTSYEDHGTILLLEPDKYFRYTYWSSMSNFEDLPENRTRITFALEPNMYTTMLYLTHDSFNTEDQYIDADKNWDIVLPKLKEVAENYH